MGRKGGFVWKRLCGTRCVVLVQVLDMSAFGEIACPAFLFFSLFGVWVFFQAMMMAGQVVFFRREGRGEVL